MEKKLGKDKMYTCFKLFTFKSSDRFAFCWRYFISDSILYYYVQTCTSRSGL